jgi:hypothetical protein
MGLFDLGGEVRKSAADRGLSDAIMLLTISGAGVSAFASYTNSLNLLLTKSIHFHYFQF